MDAFGAQYDDDFVLEEEKSDKATNYKYKPIITFYGSNDFHHLTLSLIRRWQHPFNVVMIEYISNKRQYNIGFI